jgi:2-C-methyl-D-erythritol 4-phosphate cytidylyltransferase / 2-C-methyl-D-erythritol 2,4-cyclodiphosphate synthase
MTNTAIILAAGTGDRVGGGVPKQYRTVAGRPLIAWALAGFQNHPKIDQTIVVIGDGQNDMLLNALGDTLQGDCVIGGARRSDSVYRALVSLQEPQSADCIFVHDAARGFVSAQVIDDLLSALATHEGATPFLPVVDTLAKGEDSLGDVVPRDGLVRVQTPQAFRYDAIMTSHRKWSGPPATDDAQMLRKAGFSVGLVAGDVRLEKITHAEDFARMEAILSADMISRTATGYDVHRLEAGEDLWLGGVLIPHDKGLSGHSDADVALHALTDALLGTIAAGDIGSHFPPSDPQWAGVRSARFVEYARDLIMARGGIIDHVDLTLLCELPKIAPHRDKMRAAIAGMLWVSIDNVSVKATTTEGLGYTGRGEGIAAHAAASVRVRGQANGER